MSGQWALGTYIFIQMAGRAIDGITTTKKRYLLHKLADDVPVLRAFNSNCSDLIFGLFENWLCWPITGTHGHHHNCADVISSHGQRTHTHTHARDAHLIILFIACERNSFNWVLRGIYHGQRIGIMCLDTVLPVAGENRACSIRTNALTHRGHNSFAGIYNHHNPIECTRTDQTTKN